MRTQRDFRPTLDAALEDRVALTSIIPAALHPTMSLNLAPYRGAHLSPRTTPALTLAASRPAATHYVPVGVLTPTPFVGHSLGAGAGTSNSSSFNAGLGSNHNSGLTGLLSGFNTGLGSSLNAGLGSTLNSSSGGLNPALGTFLNRLGSSLNSGLGSNSNTGFTTSPTSVAQFIAGVPFFGGPNTPSFSAGMTLPATNAGTTGLGAMNSGFTSFGGNTFGSSVFSTNSFGGGMRF